MTKKVITFGVFDLLHAGHINLIKEMTRFGEYIIIAVQKDEFAKQAKRKTTYPIKVRKELLESIKWVNEIIEYENIYRDIVKLDIDVLVVGEDQNHKFFQKAINYCKQNDIQVEKIKRYNGVSSSMLKGF